MKKTKMFLVLSLILCVKAQASQNDDAPPSYEQAMSLNQNQTLSSMRSANLAFTQPALAKSAIPAPPIYGQDLSQIPFAQSVQPAPLLQSMSENTHAHQHLQNDNLAQLAAQMMLLQSLNQQSRETTICDRSDSCCTEFCVKPFKKNPCLCMCCGPCCYAICAPCLIIQCPFQIGYVCCGCQCAKSCLSNDNVQLR